MTNTNKLRKWRSQRQLTTANYKVYFENIIEELFEPLYDKNKVKFIKEEITDKYFIDDGLLEVNAVVDAINDISVFSINETEMMGYNFDLTLSETIKEIDSRCQNPNQKMLWEQWGYDGKKWMKDINQDPSTLYVASYDGCKL